MHTFYVWRVCRQICTVYSARKYIIEQQFQRYRRKAMFSSSFVRSFIHSINPFCMCFAKKKETNFVMTRWSWAGQLAGIVAGVKSATASATASACMRNMQTTDSSQSVTSGVTNVYVQQKKSQLRNASPRIVNVICNKEMTQRNS